MGWRAGLSIKARIWIGFGAVSSLLVLVAVIGLHALGRVADNTERLGGVSAATTRVLAVDGKVADMHRHVMAFAGGPGDLTAIARVRDLQAELLNDFDGALAEAGDGDIRTALTEVRDQVERYGANFQRVAELRTRRERLVGETLLPLGNTLRVQVSGVLNGSLANGDWQSAALAGKAQEGLMQALLAVQRFLAAPGVALADEARAQLGRTGEALALLSERVEEPRQRRALDVVQPRLPQFGAVLDEVARDSYEIERILTKDNVAILARIAESAAAVKQAQLDRLARLTRNRAMPPRRSSAMPC
ncbi:MAG: hypothetical protein NVV74_00825 [Magnetospirillum sp.]|nr:hypothetical protein [Magnetospirillum sp.]